MLVKVASPETVREFEADPAFLVVQVVPDGYIVDWLGSGRIAAATEDTYLFLITHYPKASTPPEESGFPFMLRPLGTMQMMVTPEDGPRALQNVILLRRGRDRMQAIEERIERESKD